MNSIIECQTDPKWIQRVSGKNYIPEMTNELGKYWDQPSRDEMEFSENEVFMDDNTFKQLKNYSTSVPTGCYEGKMWKSLGAKGWYLRWYANLNPTHCQIKSKLIFII